MKLEEHEKMAYLASRGCADFTELNQAYVDAVAMLKGLIVSYVRRHWAALQRKAASR